MAITSNTILNQAIQLIGDNQAPVTGTYPNFDTSAAGVAGNTVYAYVVGTVSRQFSWDFARSTVALTATGNTAPFPYSYEYAYPANCIQIRQIMPTTLTDINDAVPVDWVVGNNIVSSATVKVIWANLSPAQAVISNMPPEATWDPLFQEAVVRLLASELAMAIAAKPDTAKNALEEGAQFGQIGFTRDS